MPKTEKSIPDSKECGRIKKTLLIVAGVVSLALGGIGVFLRSFQRPLLYFLRPDALQEAVLRCTDGFAGRAFLEST